MSGYKTIAVAGAGNIGQIIIEELIKLKKQGIIDEVVQLSRSAGGHAETKEWGVKLEVVDYNDHKSLVDALKGVDAVVSALGGLALNLQQPFAVAAKEAGVKLFVPSEFGNPTLDRKDSLFAVKDAIRLKLKEIGLPYSLFYTGPFSDFIFIPHLGFDFKARKVTIGGDGEKDVSFTNRRDIARFVAHVLTSLPKEKLEWKIFRIEGDRKSFNTIIRQWEERTGKQITLTHVPREELEKRVQSNPNDFVSVLFLDWDDGNGVTAQKKEDLDNNVWPEWNPSSVIDTLFQ